MSRKREPSMSSWFGSGSSEADPEGSGKWVRFLSVETGELALHAEGAALLGTYEGSVALATCFCKAGDERRSHALKGCEGQGHQRVLPLSPSNSECF